MRCLILDLCGPLMSFGDTAIDEICPTRRLPGRSLLAGLIANALGYEHGDVDLLTRLQERLRFAARLDREGRGIVDFQTAELSKQDPIWTTRGVRGERHGGGDTYSGPALRYRHYRADSRVMVALTLDPAGEQPGLQAVADALLRPERPLFLGRKGCPPASRILYDTVDAESLAAALDRFAGEGPIETEDDTNEPAGRSITVTDRRDWRLGFHAGFSRRREIRPSSPPQPLAGEGS